MNAYTTSLKNSSSTPATRRSAFAREAVFQEFHARDARAIDYDGFRDRAPSEVPQCSEELLAWLDLLGLGVPAA